MCYRFKQAYCTFFVSSICSNFAFADCGVYRGFSGAAADADHGHTCWDFGKIPRSFACLHFLWPKIHANKSKLQVVLCSVALGYLIFMARINESQVQWLSF